MKTCQKNLSLKKRIFILFFCILTLMVCAYIFVITRFITQFTQKQLDFDYNTILSEASDTLENILWNLTLTSQQLLDSKELLKNIESYLSTEDLLEKKDCYYEMLNTVSSLTMSNTDIALIYLYDIDENEIIYNTLPNIKSSDSPVLYQNSDYTFYGPGKSQSNFVGSPVVCLKRQFEDENGHRFLLSIESGYYSLDKPFHSAEQKSSYFIFTDEKKSVIYNTLPKSWTVPDIMKSLSLNARHDFHSFCKTGPHGWSVYIVIPNDIYAHDYRMVLRDFGICTLIISIIVSFLAIYFWKSVYHPLQLFDNQLNRLLSDDDSLEEIHSSIPEYDHLLQKILVLQQQIQQMIQQFVNQEKLHSRMQLEKLRAQINPHFLMNTLNTLHWMALMKHETEIDRITQSLSHLLSYNLDKQSYSTNLERELMALKEYVTLQKVRYAFQFDISFYPENTTLNYPCPKFILQPLIENSLSHGYQENMDIYLTVHVNDSIEIIIRDTGAGIQENTLLKLQQLTPIPESHLSDNMQFGIGLQYVVQSLNDFYGGNYNFSITSSLGNGTEITLNFPKLKGGGYHAENINY